MCKMSFCETDIFLKLQWEIFFDVITDLTNYIYSPWKILKRMEYTLNYSGTKFLFTEN